ncbi:hypothetical protein LMH73_014700 [Vibrio splendidus]|nr:hypothetical protein [Vibrio splendidus]MCC4882923.1 hypothetical protein [Vibrio splendidus]
MERGTYINESIQQKLIDLATECGVEREQLVAIPCIFNYGSLLYRSIDNEELRDRVTMLNCELERAFLQDSFDGFIPTTEITASREPLDDYDVFMWCDEVHIAISPYSVKTSAYYLDGTICTDDFRYNYANTPHFKIGQISEESFTNLRASK